MNTVLLVEDDPVSTRLIESLLRKSGAEEFKLQHTGQLGAALRRLRGATPDLVLLALPPSDGEGLDALRQVRAAAPHIPTVVLTDFSDQALGSQAIEAGAQDHLVKAGLDKAMLIRVVRHAIERQRILTAMEAQRDIARREVAERQNAEATAQHALEELRATEEELRQQNETLKTAQAQAEAERRRYEALFDFAPDGYLETDAAGIIREANRAASRLLKLDRASLLQAPLAVFVAKADLPAFLNRLAEWQKTGVPEQAALELSLQPRGGASFPAAITAGPAYEADGRLSGLRWLLRDITGRKQAEEQIRYQARLLANVSDAIIAADGDYRLTSWNAAAEAMYGWKAEEVLGRLSLDITQPQFPGADTQAMVRQIAEAGGWRGEATHARKDGTRFPVELASLVFRDQQGQATGYVSVNRDITERKQAEEKLRESEFFFKESQRAAFVGSYKTDFVGGFWESSEVLDQIFGIDRSYNRSIPGWLDIVHPDDRETMDRYLREEVIAKRTPFNHEYRIIRKSDGEVRWVHGLGSVSFDVDGNVVSMIGTIQDVTGRKQAEAAASQSEMRFRRLVDGNIIGVTVANLNRIADANDTLLEMIGYTRDELEHGGINWQALTPPEYAAADQRALEELLARGACTPFEKEYCRKDGSRVPFVIGASVLTREPLTWISYLLDITERKKAEEAQRGSEAKFKAAFMTGLDGFFIATLPDGRLVEANNEFEQMFGYAREEMIGKTSLQLNLYCDPADRAKLVSELQVRGRVQDMELKGRKKSGETFIASLSTSLMQLDNTQHMLGVIRDITEQKRVEEQMRRFNAELEQRVAERTAELQAEVTQHRETEAALDHERRLLRTVIDTVPDDIFACGRDGRLTLSNRAAAQAFGAADPEALLGKLWDDVFPPELAARFRANDRRVMEEGEPMIEQEERLVRANGARRWLLTTTVPLRDSQGQVTGLVGIARDITRHKEAEAALTALNGELTRALRVKDEFLATMSHELRTPLTAILGLSETLQMGIYGALTDKQNEVLRAVYESGQHLLDLINDILDLSKVEAGKMELQIERILVADVCLASVQFVKQSTQRKNLRLGTSLDARVTAISADGRRLKQILVNLLSNAVKFTPDGGEIGLSVEGDPAHQVARFTVWDTGIGIAQADMQRLFQPFVQLDSRLARDYGGTGLGLSLVRRMAELHDGSVTVESDGVPGKGSRFTVTLPWNDTDELPGASQPEALAEMPLNWRQALTVEDVAIAAEQLTRYLTTLGIQNTAYATGAGAFQKVLDLRPDVVLLDILLPDVSGWEVLRQIKDDERTRDIPVVVVSVVDDRPRGEALGADAYLVKPVALSDLKKALRQSAERAGRRSAQSALVVAGANRPLILLADDNDTVVMTLGGFLKARDYTVVVAHNGAEAVASAHQNRPGLILMDIQMPVVDGLEAIRRLRADPDAELAATPIIALTALVMPGDRERCLEAGANEYLTKPVKWARLIEHVEGLLKRE